MAKISFLVQTLLSCLNFLLSATRKGSSSPIAACYMSTSMKACYFFSNQLYSPVVHLMGVFKITYAGKTAT